MTVLLVVSVLFTFSFGSAFAAEPTDAEKAIPRSLLRRLSTVAYRRM